MHTHTHTADHAEYTDYLARLPLLLGVPRTVIDELAKQVNVHHLDAGAVIFHQGDPGHAMFVIKEGAVKILAETPDGDELVLNQLGPGEFFGEMALTEQSTRSAEAVAVGHTVLLELDRHDFESVLMHYPAVILEITRGVSAKLRFAAAYIQRAIAWSRAVAVGNYEGAMAQLRDHSEQNNADDAEIGQLIAAFFSMIEEVRQREESLKQTVHKLQIEIDLAKAERQVAEIAETDFFKSLQARAEKMRQRQHDQSTR